MKFLGKRVECRRGRHKAHLGPSLVRDHSVVHTSDSNSGCLHIASCSRCFTCNPFNAHHNTVVSKVLVFAWADVTKYQRWGGLNNRGLFSHSSGSWYVHDQGAAIAGF